MNQPFFSSSDIVKYSDRIQVLSLRQTGGAQNNLKPCQNHLYLCSNKIFNSQNNTPLSKKSIENEFNKSPNNSNCTFGSRENIITDFYYNTVNIEDNENKFLIGINKRGVIDFKGFNWLCPKGIEITWKVKKKKLFTVGEYKNGTYHWDFSDLQNFMKNNPIV